MKLEHEIFKEVLNAPPKERKTFVPQDGNNNQQFGRGINRGGYQGRYRGNRGGRGGFSFNPNDRNRENTEEAKDDGDGT